MLWKNTAVKIAVFILIIAGSIYAVGFFSSENNRQKSIEPPPVVSFPADYTSPLSIATFDGSFTLLPKGAQAAQKEEEGKKIVYQEAYENVDVIYEKEGNVVKEAIVLKNRNHPDRFVYTIKNRSGYDIYREQDGSLVFYRKGAEKRGYPRVDKLFTISASFMKDSRGIYSPTSKVEMRVDGNELIVIPDKEWLSQAQYPVIIDPTIELNILNVQSYPEVGGLWEVRFTTTGKSDLYIEGDRENTIFGRDVEFVSLRCGSETRTPQKYGNNGYVYYGWQCSEEAGWIVRVLRYGVHHQVFKFGGQRQDAYNSTISGVQSGTTSIASGSASQTVTITAVDTTKSFLVFNARVNDNAPECGQVSGQITNSTTLTFSRGAACTTSAVTIQWYVAEFSSGVKVQRGTADMSASGTGVENIVISPVDLSKSFPIISLKKTGTVYSNDDYVRARFTADNNLELSMQDSSSPSGIVEWQVVEYQDSYVQSGDIVWGTADTSKTVSITPVDMSQSWLFFYYDSADGTSSDIGQKMIRGEISDSSTLLFTRENSGQGMNMTWFLVEFTDSTVVERGVATFTSSETAKDIVFQSSNWWNTSWKRRRKITFDNSAQTENLVNFPVLITLNGARIDYTQTQNNGQDIRFVDADGTTVLDYEIEKWDETGTSYVWVKVPQIDGSSNTDYIWMYYGNPSAADAQNPAGVWSNGYVAVWHMNEDQAGTGNLLLYNDSTSNNNDGDDYVSATGKTGKIYFGQEFASGDYIDVADSASLDLTSEVTLEAWIYPTLINDFARFVAKQHTSDTPPYDMYALLFNNASNIRFSVGYSDGTYARVESATVISTNNWYYVAGTRSGANLNVFVNGNVDGTNTAGSTLSLMTNDVPVRLGQNRNVTSQQFIGNMDELRISNVARSADWIKAQYLSMTDSFFNLSASFVEEVYSNINTANSVVAFSGWNMWGGSTSYNADDNPGPGIFTGTFTSATNLTLTRDLTGSVPATLSWFVIDFSNSSPSVISAIDTPDPTNPKRSVTFIINWSDLGSGPVKAKVCKTNSLTAQNCDGGFWATSTAFTTRNPIRLKYNVQPADYGLTLNYYVFVCDDGGLCTSSVSGTFSVNLESTVPNIKIRRGFKYR